jgi:Protein of unknown function (DUF3800)
MFIAYYDEWGDDGFPSTSSPLFVLSALYQHHLNWKENYERAKAFKRQLAHDFPFPSMKSCTRGSSFSTKPHIICGGFRKTIARTSSISTASSQHNSRRRSSAS